MARRLTSRFAVILYSVSGERQAINSDGEEAVSCSGERGRRALPMVSQLMVSGQVRREAGN